VLVIALTSFGLVGFFAAPALAGTTIIGSTGVSATHSWTFNSATRMSDTIAIRDTACNAAPAYAGFEIEIYDSVYSRYVSATNDAGCNTSRTFSRTFTSPTARDYIIAARFCAGGVPVCGSWQDNPHT
jgi:hypothetical protein